MKSLALVALLAALLLPSAAFAAASRGDAPELDLPTAAGSSVSLAALKGKPVYLSFFATWCGPCNDEAPALEATAKRFQSSGLAVVGVDEEESAAKAAAFAGKYGLTYPIALDVDGDSGDDFHVYATPTNVFINRDGSISSVHVGEMTPAEITAAVKNVL
jgi:cytochrome c biogenesis protein CcmG/thiol:disulfide interchange protein DsbE